MEVAKEFLGDFSIVGFSHILSAKSQVQFRHLVYRYNQQKSGVETQVVKLGWTLIIIIAFVTAGFLIHANFKGKTLSIKIFSDLYLHLSLADWESSPVSTTVTVHPISEATFPRFMPWAAAVSSQHDSRVTLCPPRSSNTALNYDLARLTRAVT